MATTCADIIRDALVWRGVLDEAESPSSAQATRGLAALKGIYQQIIKARKLSPVSVTASYEAGENEWVTDLSGTATITVPTSIELDDPITRSDGTTATDRAPLDRAVVVVSGTSPKSYLYDANLGSWIDVQAITLSSTAPMASAFFDGLCAALCVASRYPGLPLDPAAVSAAQSFRSAMVGQWDLDPVDNPLTIF